MFLAALLAMALPQCTPTNSVSVTVEEMAREPSRWFDRCVRLDGFVSGNAFYSSPAGRYRRFAADKKDRPNEGWLGLYFGQEEELQKPFGKATLVGRVSDCVRDYEAAVASGGPDTLTMPIGYCHYQDGLVLKQVEVLSREETQFDRQKGEQNRKDFGDLLTQSETSRPPANVILLIEEFRAAFQNRDLPKLREMVQPWNFTIEHPEQAQEFDGILMGDRPPLRNHRNLFQTAPVYFQVRTPKSDPDAVPADWFACYCRIGNCDGEWPIADVDTGANASLPYFCLRIFHEDFKAWGRLTLGFAKG